MPFFGSVERTFNFAPYIAPSSGNVPAYYTSTSGFWAYGTNYTAGIIQLKSANTISDITNIRQYNAITSPGWTTIHDKDLDSNVYYTMNETSRVFYQIRLTKGGTTISQSTIFTYTPATTSVLGSCYAPQCMWTTASYGAFIIGGFSQAVLHVIEFNAAKGCNFSYTVPYTSEVYGTEVIPQAASGFTSNFAIAYTRASKQMSSWVVNMSTRSWTNRTDNSFTGGVNGPANGAGAIYYPPNKPIFTGDSATTTNRIGMTDTASGRMYVWTVTQSGGSLVWTYLSTITFPTSGAPYPYSMSVNAYNSIS